MSTELSTEPQTPPTYVWIARDYRVGLEAADYSRTSPGVLSTFTGIR